VQNLVSWTQPITLDIEVRFGATFRQLTTLTVSPASQWLSAPLYIVGQEVRVVFTPDAADDGNGISCRLILMASA
jgi:hypothetical protein